MPKTIIKVTLHTKESLCHFDFPNSRHDNVIKIFIVAFLELFYLKVIILFNKTWWCNMFFLFIFLPVKYLNAHTGIVMLRFPKSCYKLLWSALPFITSIENRGKKIPCFLNCLHVGGKRKKKKKKLQYTI